MQKPKHAFRDMPAEQLEEIFSNYLVGSWSYSGISTFARNEKSL